MNFFTSIPHLNSFSLSQKQKFDTHVFRQAHFYIWNHIQLVASMQGCIKANVEFLWTCALPEEYPRGIIHKNPLPREKISKDQSLNEKFIKEQKFNNAQYPHDFFYKDHFPVRKFSKDQSLMEKFHKWQFSIEKFNKDESAMETFNDNQNPVEKFNKGRLRMNQTLDVLAHVSIGMELGVYAGLLHECAKVKALAEGKLVHAHMIKTGSNLDVFVRNHLINMYVKCGSLWDARKVFEKMPKRNVVSWTTMIAGYVQHGCGKVAIGLFSQMLEAGAKANQFTFASILTTCASMADLNFGKLVHVHIIRSGFELNVFVGNALVTMYAKCGSIKAARQTFNEIPEPDLALQNAMIAGYAQHGFDWEALTVFCQVQQAGIGADEFTFASVLAALANLVVLEQGKAIHAGIVKSRYKLNIFVGSALVDMYAKCGCIEDACRVFDGLPERDIVLWNSMIAGYAQNEHVEEAMELFRQMQWEGMKPDNFSLSSILSTCIYPEHLTYAEQVHAHIMQSGLDSNLSVNNALVTMYARCGSIHNAKLAFDKMPERNVVSWTAIIAGYVHQKHDEEALEVFCQMQRAGMKPNQFTIATVLRACGNIASLENGKQVLVQTIKIGFVTNVCVGNALITMYAQCGNIEDARKVFSNVCEPEAVTWNAIIAGCAQHGHGKEALQLFEKMQSVGVKPDSITFVCVLSACRHGGLVNEGFRYFDSMSCDYEIEPREEHYACMVDLLGRVGQLDQAMDFIKQIPIKPSASVWRTLLGACRVHGNMEIGKFAAECILELEPQIPETYVLLSNIYAAAGRWDKVASVRNLMKVRGVTKEPGCSWIEVQNKVHTFTVRDWSHRQMGHIYESWNC